MDPKRKVGLENGGFHEENNKKDGDEKYGAHIER